MWEILERGSVRTTGEALSMSNRIAVFNNGRVEQVGTFVPSTTTGTGRAALHPS
jgi:hypothetical protein